ncbi:hypothetical protein ACLOJK_030921 [Asimina triloba]
MALALSVAFAIDAGAGLVASISAWMSPLNPPMKDLVNINMIKTTKPLSDLDVEVTPINVRLGSFEPLAPLNSLAVEVLGSLSRLLPIRCSIDVKVVFGSCDPRARIPRIEKWENSTYYGLDDDIHDGSAAPRPPASQTPVGLVDSTTPPSTLLDIQDLLAEPVDLAIADHCLLHCFSLHPSNPLVLPMVRGCRRIILTSCSSWLRRSSCNLVPGILRIGVSDTLDTEEYRTLLHLTDLINDGSLSGCLGYSRSTLLVYDYNYNKIPPFQLQLWSAVRWPPLTCPTAHPAQVFDLGLIETSVAFLPGSISALAVSRPWAKKRKWLSVLASAVGRSPIGKLHKEKNLIGGFISLFPNNLAIFPNNLAIKGSKCNSSYDGRKEKGKKETSWRIFSLKELQSATNNFNYDNKLGEGGFGSVYWGQLWDGSQIAVKRLKVWSNKAEMEFAVEVEILGRVRHKNLLSLRGYCAEGQERLIVYDYMPNLSLLSHLHGQHSSECLLDWERRMSIAIGSAEGISYLHHHSTPHIIHRDVKASNVLLDSDFQAKVADFGFAKLIPDGATHVTTRVKGTLGYLAPEYAMFGKASESCDVYSFGILLLELASGKKPIEKLNPTTKRPITVWALPLARERKFHEVADPKLNGKYVEEELKRLVLVALVSAQNSPERRPSMLEVVELLKGEANEQLLSLEKDELFKPDVGSNYEGLSGADDSSDFISEEKDPKALKEVAASEALRAAIERAAARRKKLKHSAIRYLPKTIQRIPNSA